LQAASRLRVNIAFEIWILDTPSILLDVNVDTPLVKIVKVTIAVEAKVSRLSNIKIYIAPRSQTTQEALGWVQQWNRKLPPNAVLHNYSILWDMKRGLVPKLQHLITILCWDMKNGSY